MLFGTGRRLKSVGDFRIQCGDIAVDRVNTVKYLGYMLDGNLSGNEQVSGYIKHIGARLSFLYRNAGALDFFTRKTLCNALIQPHIDYCIATWYNGILSCHRNRLNTLQRKMVRFIYSLDYRSHVGMSFFRELGWLSVEDRAKYFRLLHVFRINAGTAPEYLMNGFSRVRQIHRHNTRGSATNFCVPKTNSTEILRRGFLYSAVTDWNALPGD